MITAVTRAFTSIGIVRDGSPLRVRPSASAPPQAESTARPTRAFCSPAFLHPRVVSPVARCDPARSTSGQTRAPQPPRVAPLNPMLRGRQRD